MIVYTLMVEYEVRQTVIFSKWLSKIRDAVAKASIARRVARLENGNFGDSKSVGGGVYELRIDVGKGYRVYFTNKDNKMVVLLVGGDKSTQDEDKQLPKKWQRRFEMLETTKFDVAEYLDTEEVQSCYLNYVAEENDPDELLKAINDVARARGMTKIAKEADITREGLYKALSPDGNPAFSTVFKILNAIGYTLTPTPIARA